MALTAASQYKVKNNLASGPVIPFGTMVTLSETVKFPAPAEDTRRFRIDDMGDPNKTRTPYFVDIYFGKRYPSDDYNRCIQFGVKRMTVSF